MRRIDRSLNDRSTPICESKRIQDDVDDHGELKYDTVGVIVGQHNEDEGNVTATVSSGGLLLKNQGRIGEAALPFVGCHADQSPDQKRYCGVSTSGTGEQIMRTMLVQRIVDTALQEETLSGIGEAIQGNMFMRHPWLQGHYPDGLNVGFLALNVLKQGMVEFAYGHSTASMGIGWKHSGAPFHVPHGFLLSGEGLRLDRRLYSPSSQHIPPEILGLLF